jgi:autotransporter family porin
MRIHSVSLIVGSVSLLLAPTIYAASIDGGQTVTVPETQSSPWNINSTLSVGYSTSGTLTISEGGIVSNTMAYIGNLAGSTGVAEVTDAGSQWNSSGYLFVGNSGKGALTISEGGVVNNLEGYIGNLAGSTGVVTVSGDGSLWNNSGSLYVGNSGTGTLTISGSGIVSNAKSSIGRNAGAIGVVAVSGAGSQWNSSDTSLVGDFGNGTLTIDQGGVVNNTMSYVGYASGSTGVVTVSGDGSQWNNTGSLTVGNVGNGTLTLADQAVVSASAVTLASNIAGSGTLNIGDGNLAGTLDTASITGGAGSATVNFNHTDDIDFSPLMGGKLAVNHLTGGTTRLLAANSYTGATTISAGTLQAGAINAFSANSDHTVGTAGQLDLAGYSQTLASLNNAGVVSFNGAPGAVLTVSGNYTGNDGLLNFNTALNDDTSVTDKLVVNGNTSGTTRVSVTNAGGSGAATLNGIELVQVNGLSDGEFVQNGRIAAGAYDYYLARGVDTRAKNWYLTSAVTSVIPTPEPEVTPEPEITPEPEVTPDPAPPPSQEPDADAGPSVAPAAMVERPEAGAYSANLAAANNMFVMSLHDRLGETQYIDALTGEKKVTSMWLRNEGGHNRSRDSNGQLNTQANRYVLQLGGDIAQWSNNDMDRFHLGVMAGYGNSKNRTGSHISGYSARGSVDGYSLGMYGTWYANEADKTGLYVDSWAQYSWFNNTVDGQDLATEKYKSKGVTASVESGYTFKVGENAAKNATYFIQPKAQVTWMGVKADDHKEANGTNVSGEGDGNIQTRLGVKAFMNGYSEQDKGKDRVFQPFVEANWIHNTQDFGTTMDGSTVKQAGAGNIGELKVGVEGQINKRLNVWGNVGQQVGDKGYSDTAAMIGVKYNF